MADEKISIIMGVYNSEDTVSDAINSILAQTYPHWEFIICDDASVDNTYEILLDYKKKYPEKFVILQNETNSKLAYSLNHCLSAARGKYIARMDADDLSTPNRFEEQIKFLKENETIDLVGTAMQRFDEVGLNDVVFKESFPDKFSLRSGTPFNHATILTYKKMYDDLGGYTVSRETNRSEDHELWYRFFHHGFKGANMNVPLYLVREDENAIRRRTVVNRFYDLKITMAGYKLLNYPLSWYAKPAVLTVSKSLVPFRLQKYYRDFQARRFKNKK